MEMESSWFLHEILAIIITLTFTLHFVCHLYSQGIMLPHFILTAML